MALRFDTPSLRMDEAHRYDASPAPVPNLNLKSKKTMINKFKLELSRKSPEEKAALGDAHITAMTGNTDFPVANRLPSDANFQTAVDDLKAANADVAAKKTALKQAQETRDSKELAFDVAINSRASYCEAAQPNNDAALAGTGLPMRGAPQPVGEMPAPSNLRATMGDEAGEIDLQWDAIYGAVSYIIECREYNPPTGWSQIKLQKQSKFTVTGLVSGKTYAFRVRALGPLGEGPWSDEAVKMAS
jgi:hypothetical protein